MGSSPNPELMNRRLHWGCGYKHPEGWINADILAIPGVDICSNIRDGLPLQAASIEYITSQHALQALRIEEIMDALRELRRVLEPKGVLRMSLPDFDKAIAAYQSDGTEHQWCWDWNSRTGNFISQIIDCNSTRTPLSADWTEELLRVCGFSEVRHVTSARPPAATVRSPRSIAVPTRASMSKVSSEPRRPASMSGSPGGGRVASDSCAPDPTGPKAS